MYKAVLGQIVQKVYAIGTIENRLLRNKVKEDLSMNHGRKQHSKQSISFLLVFLMTLILSGITVLAEESISSEQGFFSSSNYNSLIYTTYDYKIVDTQYCVYEDYSFPLQNRYTYCWYLDTTQNKVGLYSINKSEVTGKFTVPPSITFQYDQTFDPTGIKESLYESIKDTQFPVVAINNLDYGAFTELELPNSITSINSCSYCTNLQSLTLPGSITFESTRCFEGCPKLKEVVMGNGIEEIPDQTFTNCRSLEKITLPNTLKSIGSQAFANCISLKTINTDNVLPASLTSMDQDTFARCAFEEITLPANYNPGTYYSPFGGYQFLTCQNLKNIYVAEGGTTNFYSVDGVLYYKDSYGKNYLAAFPAGKDITEYTVSANTTVCRAAFSNNTHLKTITFEDGVNLEEWAFSCKETADIKGTSVPGNQYSIEEGFDNTIALEKIIFKGSATIGYNCFDNCEKLSTVVFDTNKTINFSYISFVQCNALTTFTYPKSFTVATSSVYSEDPVDGFHGRRMGIFDLCPNLTTVKVYQDTNVIDANSLINPRSYTQCNQFTKFEVIPVEGYQPADGKGCSVDENGVLYDSTKSILVAWPTGLAMDSFAIPDSVKKVNKYAFYTVKGPKELIAGVGDSANDLTFDEKAFESIALNSSMDTATDSNIESIILGKHVKAIGENCFSCLKKVKSIDASDSEITAIPYGAFDRCESLTEVKLSDAVTSISGQKNSKISAFNTCKALTSVNLPTSLTALEYMTFANCSSLETIEIPESVITIADDAFYCCSNLNKVTVQSADVTVANNANPFYGVGSNSFLAQCTFYVKKGGTFATWLNTTIENDTYNNYNWTVRYIGEFTISFYNHYIMNPSTGYNGVTVLEQSVSGNSVVLKDVLPQGKFPQAATVSQRTFKGWYKQEYPQVTDVPAALTDTVSEDTIFYAYYEYIPQNYTLTLYSDGKVIDTITVSETTMLSEVLPTPTLEGYIFKGWSFDAEATTPEAQLYHIWENTALYAVWEADSEQGGGQQQQNQESQNKPQQQQQGGGQQQQQGDGKQQQPQDKPQGGQQQDQQQGKQTTTDDKTEAKVGDTTTEDGATYTVTETEDGEKGAEFTRSDDSDQKQVTVPETVKIGNENVPVVSIADNAFAGDKTMETVTLPDTITEISDNAFKGCTSLKKVDIPKDTEEIGDNAFSGCTSMTTLKFKGRNLRKVGKGAFAKCTKLKKAQLPDSVIEIGQNAFNGDKLLGQIKVNGNTLKKVGKKAFNGIKKNATITVTAKDSKTFNKVVKMIKKSGNKKLKFKFKKSKK